MNITFAVCRDSTSELIQTVAQVLGPSKIFTFDNFSGSFETCGSVAVIWDLQSQLDARNFMNQYAEQMKTRRVALVCTDHSEDRNLMENSPEGLAGSVVWSGFLTQEGFKSSVQETVNQLTGIKRKLKDSADMPKELLLDVIKKFLTSHNTCVLCTGCSDRVRATPIEYLYFEGTLYFLSEGGEKFAFLRFNPDACAAVYDAYTGFQNLGGLQVQGCVQMVPLFCDEYNRVAAEKGLNVANMQKLPVTLHMFKLLPERFELLDSALSKNSYSARQVLEL